MLKHFYQEFEDKNPESPTFGQKKWIHIPERDDECVCKPNWVVDDSSFVCENANKYKKLIDSNNCPESPKYKRGDLILENSPECPGYEPCKNITTEDWEPTNDFICEGTQRKQKYINKNFPCPDGSDEYKYVNIDDPEGICACNGKDTDEVWVRDSEVQPFCKGDVGYIGEKQTNPCVLDDNKKPGQPGSKRNVVSEDVDCECKFVEDGPKRCEDTTSYQYWKNTNPLRNDCVKAKTIVQENDIDCGHVEYVFEVEPDNVTFMDF